MRSVYVLVAVVVLSLSLANAQLWSSLNGPWSASTRDMAIGTISGVTRVLTADDAGLFISDNGATSWTKINFTASTPRCVACMPTNALNMIVAADNGHLYKSTDGGSTWSDKAT